MTAETMSDFFTSRVNGYDEHMLNEVEGCREGYRKMAELLPKQTGSLLDLGCGTGLELDEIFRLFPSAAVTGIDLTRAMLDELKKKHPDKELILIEGNYLEYDFGSGRFDAAVSFETMHHFARTEKVKLYEKICRALKPGGCYIECDYMVTDSAEEELLLREAEHIRAEQSLENGKIYHIDTPYTVGHQVQMLEKAGFQKVEELWRMGNTTIVRAKKG
jgi:tRNA (cmo5U34)-methyltransferase